MAELKTKKTDASVSSFLTSITNDTRREDAEALLKLFSDLTKEPAKMWGKALIGFGDIHYKYASGREGDWFAVGFSPRKSDLSLYVLREDADMDSLLDSLGKYKRGRGCLYIKTLADVDLAILKKLIKKSYQCSIKNNAVA